MHELLHGCRICRRLNAKRFSEFTADERREIAQYVVTLARPALPSEVQPATIRARRHTGDLPMDDRHPAWKATPESVLRLAPNPFRGDPPDYFLSDSLSVRALYNETGIAILVEIDDRTFSVPGHMLETRHALAGMTGQPDMLTIWRQGQWRIVFHANRDGLSDNLRRFATGLYIPVSFLNWDGWSGQTGNNFGPSGWHWLTLSADSPDQS